MAKTNWIDGTHLTPAQMILFFGNNAGTGHNHAGTDDDGSCPKVNLTSAAHVTGLLPLANIADLSQGTVNVKITTSHLTVEQTDTFDYLKFGNYVFLFMDAMSGVSNSTDLEISPDTSWPAAIIPSTIKHASIIVFDNSKYRAGMIQIPASTSLDMVLYNIDSSNNFEANGFTGSGSKGFAEQVIKYYTD